MGRHPCKVATSVPRLRVRHALLRVVMSATQQLEALVCYRQDRTAPALSFLQEVRSFATLATLTGKCPVLILLAAADELVTIYRKCQLSRHASVAR